MIGAHCIVFWCRGQSVIALSSGEAEYYSLVTLMSELLGLKSICLDWNACFRLEVNVDATAAIGMVSRRGLGKIKHIDTVWLWAQEALEIHKVQLSKRPTADMLADLLTKFLDRTKIEQFVRLLGFMHVDSTHHDLALDA